MVDSWWDRIAANQVFFVLNRRQCKLTFFRSCMLLTLSEIAAEAEVIPPAVATPTPTAVITREAPKVKGARARPAMAVTPPTAVVVPPVMPAILALWWNSLMSSAMAWSMMMDCQRTSARSMKILLKTRRPRWTLSAKMVNDLGFTCEPKQGYANTWFSKPNVPFTKEIITIPGSIHRHWFWIN